MIERLMITTMNASAQMALLTRLDPSLVIFAVSELSSNAYSQVDLSLDLICHTFCDWRKLPDSAAWHGEAPPPVFATTATERSLLY